MTPVIMRWNMSKQTERIMAMEQRYDQCQDAADRMLDALYVYETTFADLQKLAGYYEGKQWMKDFEDDEKGKLPHDLKRGVLSEDAVYDLLTDSREISVRMLKIVEKMMGSIL